MRKARRKRGLTEAFEKLPLAVQFIFALPALILAGLALAIGVMWYADYEQAHWTPDRAWVLLKVFSGVTAAALLGAFRQRWRHAWFWVTFVSVMLGRTAIYVVVLRQFPDWSAGMFALVTMIEIQVWIAVLYRLNYGSADVAR